MLMVRGDRRWLLGGPLFSSRGWLFPVTIKPASMKHYFKKAIPQMKLRDELWRGHPIRRPEPIVAFIDLTTPTQTPSTNAGSPNSTTPSSGGVTVLERLTEGQWNELYVQKKRRTTRGICRTSWGLGRGRMGSIAEREFHRPRQRRKTWILRRWRLARISHTHPKRLRLALRQKLNINRHQSQQSESSQKRRSLSSHVIHVL